MTRDEVIRMMRESCDTDKVDAWHNEFWTITQEELERFAALVAEAERETCAKVCDHRASKTKHDVQWEVENCAAAIRSRGEK